LRYSGISRTQEPSFSQSRPFFGCFKRLLVDHFEALATQAKADDPPALARQLLLLKEGAIVIAAMSHSAEAAREAKSVATLLFRS